MSQIFAEIHKNLVEERCFTGRNVEDLPLWGAFLGYRMYVLYVKFGRGNVSVEVTRAIKATLLKFDARWHCAGKNSSIIPRRTISMWEINNSPNIQKCPRKLIVFLVSAVRVSCLSHASGELYSLISRLIIKF